MIERIAVMSIWEYKGYNVQQSFIYIINNNEIAFHVDYAMPQLNEKPRAAIHVL